MIIDNARNVDKKIQDKEMAGSKDFVRTGNRIEIAVRETKTRPSETVRHLLLQQSNWYLGACVVAPLALGYATVFAPTLDGYRQACYVILAVLIPPVVLGLKKRK